MEPHVQAVTGWLGLHGQMILLINGASCTGCNRLARTAWSSDNTN